jgi:hypothetical protein
VREIWGTAVRRKEIEEERERCGSRGTLLTIVGVKKIQILAKELSFTLLCK